MSRSFFRCPEDTIILKGQFLVIDQATGAWTVSNEDEIGRASSKVKTHYKQRPQVELTKVWNLVVEALTTFEALTAWEIADLYGWTGIERKLNIGCINNWRNVGKLETVERVNNNRLWSSARVRLPKAAP